MWSRNGESLFSYSLSRPYPFSWFAWVVAVGGPICAVLFTFVALAADGYNLDLQYTLDLNQTLDKSYWFQKAPFSWIAKTNPSCQPALLTTGSTYFTSNLGFMYELEGMWRVGLPGTQGRILPAAPYQNALLEDCEVRSIEIDFIRKDQTMNQNNWWSWGSTIASATVSCTFQTPFGGVRTNLTTQLPTIFELTNGVGAPSLLVSTNISEHANMWFGAHLAAAWYNQLPLAMSFQQIPQTTSVSDETWDSGTVMLLRNPAVVDYTDLDFFFADVFFYSNLGSLVWMHSPNTLADWADPAQNVPSPGGFNLPNITTTVDTFAKCLYSLLLSEFGVTDRTNALISASGVQWLSNQVDLDLRGQPVPVYGQDIHTESGRPNAIQAPNAYNTTDAPLLNSTYKDVVATYGSAPKLDSTNATTIFTQYLCSIPQRKGGGALFFAVLLADLVFLQAAWTLLNLGATWWLHRKYEQANYCDGCRVPAAPPFKRKVSDYQLLPVDSRVNSRASSTVFLTENDALGQGVYVRDRSWRGDARG